jgi:tetratricopeptide (TPR) repeat protein
VTLALAAQGRWRATQGNFNEAIPWLDRSLAACRREGYYFFNNIATITGGTYARAGRTADGIALLEEAMERGGAIGYRTYYPRTAVTLAEAYLAAERFGDAFRTARQALDELSRASKNRAVEAETEHILGEMLARQAPPDVAGAEESYRTALALATEIGMRPLVARCHLGLGRLHRAASERAAAETHLTTARTMLAEMEMGFWLAQVDAEVAKLSP